MNVTDTHRTSTRAASTARLAVVVCLVMGAAAGPASAETRSAGNTKTLGGITQTIKTSYEYIAKGCNISGQPDAFRHKWTSFKATRTSSAWKAKYYDGAFGTDLARKCDGSGDYNNVSGWQPFSVEPSYGSTYARYSNSPWVALAFTYDWITGQTSIISYFGGDIETKVYQWSTYKGNLHSDGTLYPYY